MDRSKKKINWATRILDRYVAEEFFYNYLIALAVVLSLRVMIDLFVQLDEFVEDKGGGQQSIIQILGHILNYYGPKLFEYFRDFSGMIVMLAASFALTRMTRQNELTAVLASGISLKRIVAPIVLLGFLLNMLMVFDQEIILPRLADKLVRSHEEVAELNTVKDVFIPDGRDNLLYAAKYDPQRLALLNLLILIRQEAGMTGYITATEAQWDGGSQRWILTDGRHYSNDSSVTSPVAAYSSRLTPEYIWLQRNSGFKSLMSSAELKQLIREHQLKEIDQKEALGETHFRLADPIINMVMLLLGLPMLVSREKRSTKSALFLAFAGAGGCFILTFVCKLLAGTLITPFLAAMIPIIIFTPLSVLALDSIKT